MKKTLKIFGIIAVVVCLIVSAVACSNGSDDKIEVVAISNSEYTSAVDALKGYVKEELAYSRTYSNNETREIVVAEYVSNESKGEIAGDEIKLSDEQKTDFVSAEKYAVKVKVALAPDDGESAKFSETTQTVYVLKYGEKFKFMVSTPEIGERVTNSYVKMITKAENYANCTVYAFSKGKEEDSDVAVFNGGSELKFTNDASYRVYYGNETRYNSHTPGATQDDEDSVSYFVKNGNKIAIVESAYDIEEQKWVVYDIEESDEFSTIKECNEYMVNDDIFGMFSYAPAALYTMTATGFEVKVEEDNSFGGKTTSEYKIKVSDGKITEIYSIDSQSSVEGQTTYVESMEQTISISAFGSTSVTVPSYVTEALK